MASNSDPPINTALSANVRRLAAVVFGEFDVIHGSPSLCPPRAGFFASGRDDRSSDCDFYIPFAVAQRTVIGILIPCRKQRGEPQERRRWKH